MKRSLFIIFLCILSGVDAASRASDAQTRKPEVIEKQKSAAYVLSRYWAYSPTTASKDDFTFRKFVDEKVKLRNVFVLSCPKNGESQITLEIIPPTELAGELVDRATDKLQNTIVRFIDKNGTTQAQGDYDMIATFVYPHYSGLDHIEKFLDNNEGEIHIVEPNIRFRFRTSDGDGGGSMERRLASKYRFFRMSEVKKKCVRK